MVGDDVGVSLDLVESAYTTIFGQTPVHFPTV